MTGRGGSARGPMRQPQSARTTAGRRDPLGSLRHRLRRLEDQGQAKQQQWLAAHPLPTRDEDDFYDRIVYPEDRRPGDNNNPNWPRRPGPRTHFLKIPAAYPDNLSPGTRSIWNETSYLINRLDVYQGFPHDPRLTSEQKSRVYIVSSRRESEDAAAKILQAASEQPILSLDTEDFGFDDGRTGIAYILAATSRADAFIYCLPAFASAREALGETVCDLLEGRNPDYPDYATLGVAIRGDQEKLSGLNFANPLDVRGIISAWQRGGFVDTHFFEKHGLKTGAYYVHGECFYLVYPAPRRHEKERRTALEYFRMDIGAERPEPCRNMRNLYQFDGSRDILEWPLCYMVSDAFAPIAIFQMEILRGIINGRSVSSSLRMMVARVLHDSRVLFNPPSAMDETDPFFLNFYGEANFKAAMREAASRARKRQRNKTLRANRIAARLIPEDNELEEEMRDAIRRLERQQTLQANNDKRLILDLEERIAAFDAGKPSHLPEPKDQMSAKGNLARVRRFSSPFYGTVFRPVHARACCYCGMHGPKVDCPRVKAGDVSCEYPLCSTRTAHTIFICPDLHGTCFRCSYKGHLNGSCGGDPGKVAVVVRAFNAYAKFGRYTRLSKFLPEWGALSFAPGNFPQDYRYDAEQCEGSPISYRETWLLRDRGGLRRRDNDGAGPSNMEAAPTEAGPSHRQDPAAEACPTSRWQARKRARLDHRITKAKEIGDTGRLADGPLHYDMQMSFNTKRRVRRRLTNERLVQEAANPIRTVPGYGMGPRGATNAFYRRGTVDFDSDDSDSLWD